MAERITKRSRAERITKRSRAERITKRSRAERIERITGIKPSHILRKRRQPTFCPIPCLECGKTIPMQVGYMSLGGCKELHVECYNNKYKTNIIDPHASQNTKTSQCGSKGIHSQKGTQKEKAEKGYKSFRYSHLGAA